MLFSDFFEKIFDKGTGFFKTALVTHLQVFLKDFAEGMANMQAAVLESRTFLYFFQVISKNLSLSEIQTKLVAVSSLQDHAKNSIVVACLR